MHLNLESVGCIVTKDGNSYPVCTDGTIDWDNCIEVEEMVDEWFNDLSREDNIELIKFKYKII
mgnify:CR=1 FL=1